MTPWKVDPATGESGKVSFSDLVALDLSLPDGSGLPLIEHLRSVEDQTRIVVLSMHDGEPYVSEALRRGASGYVTKGVAPEELVAGWRAVMQGECFLSSDLRQRRAPSVFSACAALPWTRGVLRGQRQLLQRARLPS